MAERTVRIADLGSTDGISAAAVTMAEAVCIDVLWPVVAHTPPEKRAELFERFFCALTGAACSELGPERAKQALEGAKIAIDDLAAERRGRGMH